VIEEQMANPDYAVGKARSIIREFVQEAKDNEDQH